MADEATFSSCCFKGFAWNGTPIGTTTKLADHDTYIVGSNPDRAILFIHDALGWKFPNARLLADHLAQEVNATVYIPNFFDEVLSWEKLLAGQWDQVDLPGWTKRNNRTVREPEVFDVARALRARFKKVGATGYCFGGWAVFRLGAKGHDFVDAIVAAHPTWLTEDDIDNVAVPTQIQAPEIDNAYPLKLKQYTFNKLMENGVPFDYRHFPGVEHACMTRGDPNVPGEQQALEQGKNAAVFWFKQYL